MLNIRMLSALEKVFWDDAPAESPLLVQGLRSETVSFQLAFRLEGDGPEQPFRAEIRSPLREFVRVRLVRDVPVRLPIYPDAADQALRSEPGLYPDRLEELQPHSLTARRHWQALWIDVCTDDSLPGGSYPLEVLLIAPDGRELGSRCVPVEILPGQLPPQSLRMTRWFHCDALAQYYGVAPFSEAHWTILERFIRAAVRSGSNMLLTPIHTPPLDTRVGGERLTTQLVEVEVTGGGYRFNMDRLRRWIRLCRECGVEYFEAAHLYTQWGAAHAPKIVARADGEIRRIFGWDTDACSPEYNAFLHAYIPALRALFREEGVEDRVVWHISDEPSGQHLPQYLAARRQVDDVLDGCTVMDALSNYEFFRQGVVACPVVANNHLTPFLQAGVEPLWTYYCCAQYKGVSNMFIALPSSRNRAIAPQLFKFRIAGLLHWGFNFYASQYSDYPVNPYATTDADGWVPAGDPFQVYPGPGGVPEESLRMMVALHALQDLRAMELLASLAGREVVLALIEEEMPALTFDACPDAAALLRLRRRVNEALRPLL